MRLFAIPAAAFVLTACAQSVNSLPPAPSNAFQSAPLRPTAADLGLWPREGPAVRVCGFVGAGYARCQAWRRTDVAGAIEPDTPGGYAPSDLQRAYGLTAESATKGNGETVAIVDAYDNPKAASDLNVYRRQFGLPPCTVSNGCFTKRKFTSQTNLGWAGEEALDVDMVSAICPNCKILLVEAASARIGDLSAAEEYATAHAHFVSNSWSGNEGNKAYDTRFDVTGVVITAATGDYGHNATAQWPAILPTVVGVGGTVLRSVSPHVESAWAGAGSGCSTIYAKPKFQSDIHTACAMRAQADVSAEADPYTGVAVYDTFQQPGWTVFGGTSVATPIIASVFALTGDASGNRLDNLYSNASNLRDVSRGSNGSCGAPLCVAGSGWDGPTGLG
ncbi:MAG TPA: S53 family peptidase, partial [Candidatus Cybelea sp.]